MTPIGDVVKEKGLRPMAKERKRKVVVPTVVEVTMVDRMTQ